MLLLENARRECVANFLTERLDLDFSFSWCQLLVNLHGDGKTLGQFGLQVLDGSGDLKLSADHDGQT